MEDGVRGSRVARSVCLEAAVNPLSLSKLDMKRKQVTHQAEMDHVLNLTRVATNNISVLTTRIQALEKLNDSLKDKVLGEAEERSNAACFPKNVKRSVLARRLLNARKNKTRIYNNESTWGRRNMRSKSRSEEFQDNLENFDLKDDLNENYASVQVNSCVVWSRTFVAVIL